MIGKIFLSFDFNFGNMGVETCIDMTITPCRNNKNGPGDHNSIWLLVIYL